MEQFREKIDQFFYSSSELFYIHRLKTLLILFLVLFACIANLPNITVDTSNEGFLHEKDPVIIDYNEFRDQFGRDEIVILAIQPDNIFSFKTLNKIKALHEELEDKVPYLDEVTSLINARNTRGEGDTLLVEDLLEGYPDISIDLTQFKQIVSANPMYKNLLISEDQTVTTVAIKTLSRVPVAGAEDVLESFDELDYEPENMEEAPYLSDEQNSEMVGVIQDIIAKYRADDFKIYMAGSPVVIDSVKKLMFQDMKKFMIFAIIVIATCLFLLFRRISGVILPLVIVILSLLSVVGLMAATGVAIKVPTQILPSFLLAVGVGDSVHLLAIFFKQFNISGDKKASVLYAVEHSGLAIVMTSITTASGLLSFAGADIAPISDLGIFSSVGVMLAMIVTLVIIPPIISLMPIKPKKSEEEGTSTGLIDKFLHTITDISIGNPKEILIVTCILLILAGVGISRLSFSHNILYWLPDDFSVRTATEFIDNKMKGSVTLEVILDTGIENGLHDPKFLKQLEEAVNYVETIDYGEVYTGKAWSLNTILKEINQALNSNDKKYYSIPLDQQLIAQELLLFENSGSDDLEDMVDSLFQKVRVTIKVPFTDAVKYSEFTNNVNKYFQDHFQGVSIKSTGMMVIFSGTISKVISSMAKSYLIAFIVITILMILLIGNFKIGLLSMIPNLFPIVMILGLMGWMDMPMDLFTILIGSIAIGLAVDDTIHFMHNFRRYYAEEKDSANAIRHTLLSTGRAMLVTSIVLSAGFFSFMLASMNNLFNFGVLTGMAILLALLADYFIAPALMLLFIKENKNTKESQEESDE